MQSIRFAVSAITLATGTAKPSRLRPKAMAASGTLSLRRTDRDVRAALSLDYRALRQRWLLSVPASPATGSLAGRRPDGSSLQRAQWQRLPLGRSPVSPGELEASDLVLYQTS